MTNQGNVLVMQSGGSTQVINRSLFGVFREVSAHRTFGEIYGARHGLDGFLAERLVNLGTQSKVWWERTARTPGAILGSSRRRLKPEDIEPILKLLAKYNIRYWFIIGGNDSAETGHRIAVEAQTAGRSLTVIHVPKTIDNDLVATDHSPGYGSAARFVALATLGAGRDAESMGKEAPITIIEIMGRDAGWLAAAAILAKREERDAPHLICVPEVPVDETHFLDQIEQACRRFGFAIAVVAENVRGVHGVLGGQQEPQYVDQFGHPYYDGAGRYLAERSGRHMKMRVRYEKPGTIQRSLAACISKTDALEAESVGRAAVRYALRGATDQMVTLVREESRRYACSTGMAPLDQVVGKVRRIPNDYLIPGRYMVTSAFAKYARPLIGSPIPRFSRLL